MTTPSDSPPPSDPENPADSPTESPSNENPSPDLPDEDTASDPTPAQSDGTSTGTSPASSESVPSGATPPISGSGPLGGIVGLLKRNVLAVGIGAGVVVVVVIVVVLLAAGVLGGGGGPSDPQDYVLDDTEAVAVANVAAILEAVDIPAQLAGFGSLGFPNVDPEDSTAWVEAWESEWADDFPRVWGAISLEDINTAVLQEDADGRDLGWMFFGLFAFEDVRESLEDAGRESDTYRDFETWGDDVALLEEKGIILLGPFVQDVLKALDTERGFVDDTSVLKQVLPQTENGLASRATSTCAGSFFQAAPVGCEAVVEVVTEGDSENTTVTGTYLFGSESRAETGVEDIEDSIDGQDTYDADLNEINTDGMVVSYEVSIVGEFVGSAAGGFGGDSGPLSYALEDITYVGMLNVAGLLEAAEIPALLPRLGRVDLPEDYLDEPEVWKEEWEDYWDGWFMGMVGEAISLRDITHVVSQITEEGDLGVMLFGAFVFDDIRTHLEDQDWEQETYRDFELWDDSIALLEERGVVAFNNEDFVKDLLKALDTGEGFLEDASELRAGLTRAGEGLSIAGSTNCDVTIRAQLRSCEAAVEVIKDGDAFTTELSAIYVFSSERRAESALEDLEDAIDDQETYDADIDKIEAEGEFVSYEITIHE